MISAAINSMLHHPAVHDLMLEWGFDVLERWNAELSSSIKQVEAFNEGPQEELHAAQWAINYAGTLLIGRHLVDCGILDANDKPLQHLFESRFPNVVAKAEEIIRVVDAHGLANSGQHLAIYEELIDRLELAPFVKAFKSPSDE